jgi:exodeoxyribonuclease-1
MALTFYWHDYETWGTDPRRDRPAQFAGVRTDEELHPIGDPLVLYCRPADDMLPQPEAALVTGLTPQRVMREGVCEAEFMSAIQEQLARSGTCGVGYNTLRFDDEFTRYGLYRNFFDPYAREWQHGNSRWDLIDLVRCARALRPEGIEWPVREDGVTSFRLEELTAANGIEHVGAHDALADVYATIALARLVRERQPRLYDYLLHLRNKHQLARQLNPAEPQPVLHVSSKYPAGRGCIAMVAPVAAHPSNKNGVIVFDLRYDPRPLLELEAEEIRERLFTPQAELAEGEERIPLKTVHLNRCPVIVPMNTLTEQAAAEWQIDVAAGERHLAMLRQTEGLARKIQAAHAGPEMEASGADPDQNLYGGGFFSDADRRRMDLVRQTAPQELADADFGFQDARLPEMLFRYRARNWPETLTDEERLRWDEFRRERLADPRACGITLNDYRERVARLTADASPGTREREILTALAEWPAQIGL